jgi:hypothetical protein
VRIDKWFLDCATFAQLVEVIGPTTASSSVAAADVEHGYMPHGPRCVPRVRVAEPRSPNVRERHNRRSTQDGLLRRARDRSLDEDREGSRRSATPGHDVWLSHPHSLRRDAPLCSVQVKFDPLSFAQLAGTNEDNRCQPSIDRDRLYEVLDHFGSALAIVETVARGIGSYGKRPGVLDSRGGDRHSPASGIPRAGPIYSEGDAMRAVDHRCAFSTARRSFQDDLIPRIWSMESLKSSACSLSASEGIATLVSTLRLSTPGPNSGLAETEG